MFVFCGCMLCLFLVCVFVLSLSRPSSGTGWHHKPICFYVPSLNCTYLPLLYELSLRAFFVYYICLFSFLCACVCICLYCFCSFVCLFVFCLFVFCLFVCLYVCLFVNLLVNLFVFLV